MTSLRLANHRLRARAHPILQTALAALAAWYLSVLLLPDPKPIFACIATVAAIGATHGQHRQRALHLVAGVVLGLAVAVVLVHLIGSGAPQMALLIVLAMSLAVLLNGSDLVISEAAVSAMLGGQFTPNRILEAIIGGAVALVVALLFPPRAALTVSRAAQPVFGQLGRSLERTASALEAGDPERAEAALEQARAIDELIEPLDEAIATGRETVRTAPPRFGEREGVERYDRSFEQIDLAVRDTRVLARHARRALRTGDASPEVAPAVATLARSVWELAAAYEEPERAEEARELAARAAATAAPDALGESVRSTAVDLIRAAELVAGEPETLPSEELLLGLARCHERLRAAAAAAEERDTCPFVAVLGDPPDADSAAERAAAPARR